MHVELNSVADKPRHHLHNEPDNMIQIQRPARHEYRTSGDQYFTRQNRRTCGASTEQRNLAV